MTYPTNDDYGELTHFEDAFDTVDNLTTQSRLTGKTYRQNDNPKHLLALLGNGMIYFGVWSCGTYLGVIIVQLILDNLLNLINPFLLFPALTRWIMSPLTWQFISICVTGVILFSVGQAVVSWSRPKNNDIVKWYLPSNATIAAKLPFATLAILFSTPFAWLFFKALVFGSTNQLDASQYPLFVPSIILYVSLLPLPLVHLIWTGRIEKVKTKLFATCIAILSVTVLAISASSQWLEWEASLRSKAEFTTRNETALAPPAIASTVPTPVPTSPSMADPKPTVSASRVFGAPGAVRLVAPPSVLVGEAATSHAVSAAPNDWIQHFQVDMGFTAYIPANYETESPRTEGMPGKQIIFRDRNARSVDTNAIAVSSIETVGGLVISEADFELSTEAWVKNYADHIEEPLTLLEIHGYRAASAVVRARYDNGDPYRSHVLFINAPGKLYLIEVVGSLYSTTVDEVYTTFIDNFEVID